MDGAKGDKGDIGLEGQKGDQVCWKNQQITNQDPFSLLKYSE